MGVSSSGSNPEAARGGDSHIIPLGQTEGCYGNEPYFETKQGKADKNPTQLKP